MKNKKMKIGIDIDDVILDFVPCFLEYYNLKFDKNIVVEDINNYNFWEVFGLDFGKFKEILDEFHQTDYYTQMNLVDGFNDAFNSLNGEHDLFVITARSVENKTKTHKCIKEQIPDFNLQIIFSEEFYGKGKTKAEICNDLGISMLVDDQQRYALDCAQKGIKVFLMDKPWNQDCEHENIIRVKNWKEILEKLK